RREGVQSGRSVSRLTQGEAGSTRELARRLPRGTRELERGAVVVREHLRPVVAALGRERLDPLGREPVLLRAVAARDLRVGDVAHEHVRERVLTLVRHGRPALTAEKLLALEGDQQLLQLPGRKAGDGGERADPE